jgi:hypothetical protein
MKNETSIALMKFLAGVANGLGVGEHVYVVGGAVRNFVMDPTGKESYGAGGYKPTEVVPATIQEDVARREFTFNTLLWQMADLANGPHKAQVIDLTGCGLRDLREGVARCPADPDKTFSDDPSRMVRAIKFLIKYGMRPAPETEAAICRNVQKLKQIPSGALSNLLINTIFRDEAGQQFLRDLDRHGVWSSWIVFVVREIAQEDKKFREALSSWADKEAPVGFLFVLKGLGLPSGKRLSAFTPVQQQRVWEVTSRMLPEVAEAYLAVLTQPGKVLDTEAIIKAFDLKGSEIRKVTDVARQVLLDTPELVADSRKLTEIVGSLF